MSREKEVKIKQATNGYIVTFDSIIGYSTEVYEKFEDMVKEVRKKFGEEEKEAIDESKPRGD